MTREREWKHIQRKLRTIPLEAIAPAITNTEASGRGLWCLVDGELSFVPVSGNQTFTDWGDFLECAQFVRWVKAHPERIHQSHQDAVDFVRRHLGLE